MNDNRKWQMVIITANDGSVHRFSGPAAFHKGDPLRTVIKRIEFTEPQDMPSDCKWEEFTEGVSDDH